VVDHCFDQFTKQFSRRRVAKGLLAGGTAGALALLRSLASQANDCLTAFSGACATQHAAECARICAESARNLKGVHCACLDGCFHAACGPY
jgi:hypothetical protein